MKKIIYTSIFLILALFCVTGCEKKEIDKSIYSLKNNYDENKNYIKDITNINNFVEMFNKDEEYIVVIGQTVCSHCIDYRPKVNRVAYSYDMDIYWIEYDTLTYNDKVKVKNLHDKFSSISTPYTIIIKNGDIIDEMVGESEEQEILDLLINNNLVKVD